MHDGDEISIDAETRRLDLVVDDEEMARRRETWTAPPLKYSKGTLYKYAK